MKLLAEIIERGLCCGCGTCAGVCPTEAIKMNISEGLFVPEIDEAKCNNCQLCIQSCPGHSVDFKALRSRIFGREPECNSIGNYLHCYIGHSMDDLTRFDSTSGGIITHLLIFALENNLIDGALVTRMRKNNPLEPESFIARTAEEIVEASKSKYCPVAANVCLRQILKENGRFAVVGLPCHIHGIRKAETVFRTLNKRIVLHLGLLCSHTVNFAGTYFLLKKLRLQKDEVSKIAYRGMGWPGSMSIETKNASRISLPLLGDWQAYWPLFASFFFTPMRCTLCPDQAAELADISFGDAWLPELKSEKSGLSIILSRTSEGESLLSKARSAKVILTKRVGVEKVKQSQFVNLKFKKGDLPYRLSLMSSMGKEIPIFNPMVPPSDSFISALRAFYIYFNIKASLSRHFKDFLVNAPFPLIRLYYGIYKSLSLI
jgi:coenzyme F420 hydrogenase subunit beta